MHLALADGAHHGLDATALQAVNAIDADDYPAMSVGIGIMLIGAAGATIPLAGAIRVLGWIGLVLGVLIFTPIGFIGFIGTGLRVIAVSAVLFLRSDEAPATAAVPSTAH